MADTDLQDLQALISQGGPSGLFPIPPSGGPAPANVQPPMAPTGTPPIVPSPAQPIEAPNLGTGQENLPPTTQLTKEAQQAQWQQQQQQAPPKPSTMPALAGFLQQMFKGPGYQDMGPGQPARPISRLDAFENFLGNFLQSFAAGMSNAGTGPAANARGFGAAVMNPYHQQLGQYQMEQAQQAQQSQLAYQQAQTQHLQAQTEQMGQIVTLPNGVQMPLALAQKVYPAMVSAAGRVEAAGVKRYTASPFGVLDTQTGKLLGGGTMGNMVTVTPEMQKDMNLPEQLLGKQMKVTDLSSWLRGQASAMTIAEGSQGPYLGSKIAGPGSFQPVTSGGKPIGSRAANPIAWANLQLKQGGFERDTFGEFVSPELLKKYPQLTSYIDDRGERIGWKSPTAPTANIKTQGQTAQDILPVLQEARRQLAEANKKGMLGPGAGRMNEWLVGKLGADNPQFSAARTITSMAMTGMLKAHFGARAPVGMFEHFNDLLDSGKMTYGDLDASLNSFEYVMKDYAGRVRTSAPNAPTATPAAPG